MKINIMLCILFCWGTSFLKGSPLSTQMAEAWRKISDLSQNFTLDGLNEVITAVDNVSQSKEKISRDEVSEIMELSEYGMFFHLLRKYVTSCDEADEATLRGLKEWEACKPEVSVYIESLKKR